jgi:hypothetical protein
MASLLDKVSDAVRKGTMGAEVKRSAKWFQDKIKGLEGSVRNQWTQTNAPKFYREAEVKVNPKVLKLRANLGDLYAYYYNPKHRATLPYYDMFPLVLPIEKYSDGFLGINLHYLPMSLRLQLLDRLVDYSNNTKFDESTLLKVNYKKLKNIDLIKPTLKRYLAGHVKSMFRRVDADEFTVATLLPVQRFSKSSSAKVWNDSRSMI